MILGFSIQQQISRLVLALSFTVSLSSVSTAQTICMVTADFQTGEDYIVYWEPIAQSHGIDSVIIYRKQGVQNSFSKIGSVEVSNGSQTFFVDENAMTYDTTKYAITYLYSDGEQSPRSPWHQAVVMNYVGGGDFVWTKYRIENQTDESYIGGYEVLKDNLGLGNFLGLGGLLNSILNYTDLLYILTPNAKYVVEVELPTCNFEAKANIHTSRSNIKNQISNPATPTDTGSENEAENEAENDSNVSVTGISGTEFSIVPNPASSMLTIHSDVLIDNIWISGMNGSLIDEFDTSDKTFYEFSTEHLENGIYFVNVEVNNVVTTKRVLIAH